MSVLLVLCLYLMWLILLAWLCDCVSLVIPGNATFAEYLILYLAIACLCSTIKHINSQTYKYSYKQQDTQIGRYWCVSLQVPEYACVWLHTLIVAVFMNYYVCLVVCLANYDCEQARAQIKYRWHIARHKASHNKVSLSTGIYRHENSQAHRGKQLVTKPGRQTIRQT